MKLLLCNNCQDVFNLTDITKICSCGQTHGKYIDDLNAEYSGQHAIPLGFSNSALSFAIRNQPTIKEFDGLGLDFSAFVVPKDAPTFIKK